MKNEPQPGSIVPVFPGYFKVVMTPMRGLVFADLRPCMEPSHAQTEPCDGDTRYSRMRNEEYTMELFLAVGLVAATLAGAAGLFETRPSSAASPRPTETARLDPVRVVGTPFVPNTRPSER
jgi:hypothetical protein